MAKTLTTDEVTLIKSLRSSGTDPVNIVVITDAGRDHDDELAFAVLKGLERLGMATLRAAVVNLSTDLRRTRLVKGTVEILEFSQSVPVAVGANDNPSYKPKPYEFDAPYLADERMIELDGQALLKRICEDAAANGEPLTLMLLSGTTDATMFFSANSELARRAIAKVVIMGGVQLQGNMLAVDERGQLVPDDAYNNCVDKGLNPNPTSDSVGPSARRLYTLLQSNSIPMVIVTRHAAYACAVSPAFYEGLADSNHPVALRLRDGQQAAIEKLWEDVQQGLLGHRRNREWFYQTFSSHPDRARQQLEANPKDPWSFVDKLNLYDPLTVLAAVPNPAWDISSAVAHGPHHIIGLSHDQPGISDPHRMRCALSALAKLGLGAEI